MADERIEFSPVEITKIANRLARFKRDYRRNGIHWETVKVVVLGRDVYLSWKENQGAPYLTNVPCSEFVLKREK